MSSLRILQVTPTYYPAMRYGGTIESVRGLCRALAAKGHSVSVYTTNVDGRGVLPVRTGRPVDVDGAQVTYFASPFPRYYWSPPMGIALAQNARSFDVIHAHSVFLWPTTACSNAARRARVPYVISPHGMIVKDLFERKSGALKKLWMAAGGRAALERAAAVHVTSRIESEEIGRFGLRLRGVTEIPNGIDVTAAPERAERGHMLFLGRVNWKKGLDRLIDAMPLLPEAKLVVAGNDEEGYSAKLRSRAAGLGVAPRIEFRGPVYGEEKKKAFAEASVFVLPSVSENFGISVLEAMAAGVPVVVSAGVGIADVVRASGAGLVAGGDAHELAAAIARVLSDADLRASMSAAGRREAQRFSWDSVAERFEGLYQGLKGRA